MSQSRLLALDRFAALTVHRIRYQHLLLHINAVQISIRNLRGVSARKLINALYVDQAMNLKMETVQENVYQLLFNVILTAKLVTSNIMLIANLALILS